MFSMHRIVGIAMTRRMVSIPEEDYKRLVQAKGKLEMESGQDTSLGDVVAAAAVLILAGYGLSKFLEEVSKRR